MVLPEASLAGAVVSVVVVGTAVEDWPKAADASARTAAATGSARKDQREDDRILREADCKSKSLVESTFGTGLDHPALTLVAFLYGKAASRESSPVIILPKALEPRRSKALPKRGVGVLYLRRAGNGAGRPPGATPRPAARLVSVAVGMTAAGRLLRCVGNRLP